MGMVKLLVGCQFSGPDEQSKCWEESTSLGAPNSDTVINMDVLPSDNSQRDQRETTELSRIVIGLDGSDSLLGHLQVDGNVWIRIINAIELLTTAQPVKTVVARVGGPDLEPVASLQASNDPCFFTGCPPFAPVSSNLSVLWQQVKPGQLTILVSDLETNVSRIGPLVKAIAQSEPEAVGVVAIKAPFSGQLFDPFTGKAVGTTSRDRPLYLLVTGPRGPVEGIVDEGAGAFGQSGLESVFSSLLPARTTGKPAFAKKLDLLNDSGSIDTKQQPAAIDGRPVFVGTQKITDTAKVRTLELKESGRSWSLVLSVEGPLLDTQGEPYPPGQLVLEQYSPWEPEEPWQPVQQEGVKVQDLRLQKGNFSASILLESGLPDGFLRARLPANRNVEEWWLALNANGHDGHDSIEGRTRGLYGLLTSLQASLQDPSAPPAFVFCFAHSRT